MPKAMTPIDAPEGSWLVTADGRVLPLRGVDLRADARAGLCRVVLEQRFANGFAEPLQVTYSMPLPEDGVVSGYAFRIGDRRITGEIDRRQAARERFEEALIRGHSAALLEQDRSSLFTHEIANVPPGAEVICELSIDQKLRWLEEGMWEWRFPTVVAPRYLGDPGRVADADRVAQDVADSALPSRLTMKLALRNTLPEGKAPESSSHPMCVAARGGAIEVTLAEAARLDRDVVVRWAAAKQKPGLALDLGRPADGRPHAANAYGLLTLVPPSGESRRNTLPRDVIVLLDTSGSMAGEPLAQAKRIVATLIGTLHDRDWLELIEFSNAARSWKRKPVPVTESARADALGWIEELQAAGNTEMRDAIVHALDSVREEAQRQVILVTDGQVGFEQEVVQEVLRKLPAGSRLHTVGVGSAVNRSLTACAARAGRGVEVLAGLGEDAERAARRLVARTDAPLVVDLAIGGSALLEHAPRRLPDLFAGCHRPDGKPESLLRLGIRIARNLAIDEIRRSRTEALDPNEVGAVDPTPALPDPLLRRAIVDCRKKLGEQPARALDARLASAGAEPDAALAKRLGMQLNTFLQNFSRARRALAECLKRRGVDLERMFA